MSPALVSQPWWVNIYKLWNPTFEEVDLDGGIEEGMFLFLKEDRDIILEVDGKSVDGLSRGSLMFLLKQRPTTLTMVLRTHPDPPVHLQAFLDRYGNSDHLENIKVKQGIEINTAPLVQWWDGR